MIGHTTHRTRARHRMIGVGVSVGGSSAPVDSRVLPTSHWSPLAVKSTSRDLSNVKCLKKQQLKRRRVLQQHILRNYITTENLFIVSVIV